MSAALQGTLKGHCDRTDMLSGLMAELNALIKQFADLQHQAADKMEQIANRVVHSELMPEVCRPHTYNNHGAAPASTRLSTPCLAPILAPVCPAAWRAWARGRSVC